MAEGTYCPTDTVRSNLDAWRRARQLPWCLLLPFPASRGHTSFGSLMLYRDEVGGGRHDPLDPTWPGDRCDDGQLQADLTAATTDAAARRLGATLRVILDSNDSPPRQRPTPRQFLAPSEASELRAQDALAPLADRLERPLILARPPTWSTTFGVHFAVLGPDLNGAGPPTIELVLDDDLTTLQTMLNGTRQAVLHQHQHGSVRLTRRPGPVTNEAPVPAIEDYLPDPSTAHFGPGLEFDDLLTEAAARHRGSLTLAVYLIDRRGDRLLRVAGHNVRNGDGAPDLAIDVDTDDSSIALVVQDNRPPQITNRVLSEPFLHGPRTTRWLGTGGQPADFSQVVVPIPGTAASGRSTAVGALVAQCRSGNGRVFGTHDLQYLEQLASRISLRRANLLFSEATRALAELTSHTMLASAGISDPSRLEPAWRQLPIDFANARPFLRRTLQLVHHQTPSIGVALALLDVRQDQLIRTIEVGDGDLVPETWGRRKPPTGLAGLGTYALQHGQLAEVANVGAKGAFHPFGGLVKSDGWGSIRSATATGVVVADRPVGVLLVAAAQEYVLSELANFIQAATQQICLALILAQRAEERRAFAFSSSTALHAHEILKRADQLRTNPDPKVASLGNEIEQLVDVLRSPEGGQRLPTDPIEALHQAIAEVGVGYYVAWDSDPPELPPFPGSTILAVKRAAVEILKNSKLRMVGSRIQIRARVIDDLPIPQLLIQLQHCIEEPLRDELLPLLYRAPIEDPGGRSARRHYGAFTAGYWMRAVGGDVYLWRNQTDSLGRHWIGTAIEVPIFTLSPEPSR